MRVLVIDPGYARAGAAVLSRANSRDTLLHSCCIETTADTPFAERIHAIVRGAEELIAAHRPSVMALERLYLSTNQKTAMQVAEVRGALIALAAAHNLPIVEFTPPQIKVAVTGNGAASKDEIMRMLPRLITFPSRERLDDEYDAIAIGLTALASYRHLSTR